MVVFLVVVVVVAVVVLAVPCDVEGVEEKEIKYIEFSPTFLTLPLNGIT